MATYNFFGPLMWEHREQPYQRPRVGHLPNCLQLTVKFRQPSHEFTFGVGMSFISYPLVLTPLV
jgi:hypothetical protein